MYSWPDITSLVLSPFLIASSWWGTVPYTPLSYSDPIACTMEAKQCPDGSYVGRVPPSCEFAPCPTQTVPSPISGCVALSYDLYYGSNDSFTSGEVSALQNFLYARGYFPNPAVGQFGPVTHGAVARFQIDNGLPATGYVGAQTRAAIARVSCGGNPPPQTLSLASLSPTSGGIGTRVTITGSGFLGDNTINFGSGAIPAIASNTGTQLTFTVPSYLNPTCYYSELSCLMPSFPVTPGTYNVSVTNARGTSNTLSFTVTGNTSANFSASPLSGSAPLVVTFSAQMSDEWGTYIVNFGDGSSEVMRRTTIYCIQAPCIGPLEISHTYMQAGTYTATLSRSGTVGTLGSVTITVSGGAGGGPISINGLDAPTRLSVGQTGTWTVRVNTVSANLRYAVLWGDEGAWPFPAAQSSAMAQTSATFSHAYARPGTYIPIFTITDDAGRTATVSASVTVTPF